MKRADRKLLSATAAVGLLLLLLRRAKASSAARGDVHIGPVTVERGPAMTEQERLLWPRLELAIQQAKRSTAFDEDMGAQKNPGAAGQNFIANTVELWRQTTQSPPDMLERMLRESKTLPTSNLLVNATARVRALTGWDPEWATVTRTPSDSEIKEIRAAIELWQTHSQTAGDYLQLLLDDALSLSRS